jgi:hypothetical protein
MIIYEYPGMPGTRISSRSALGLGDLPNWNSDLTRQTRVIYPSIGKSVVEGHSLSYL